MGYGYPEEVVQELIKDYEAEWGATLAYKDAVLMLSLFDGLSVLFEKYEGEVDDHGLPTKISAPYKFK